MHSDSSNTDVVVDYSEKYTANTAEATFSNSSSLAYILNKPDLTAYALKSELATVATSGSYTTTGAAELAQIPSDWK